MTDGVINWLILAAVAGFLAYAVPSRLAEHADSMRWRAMQAGFAP